MNVRLTEVERFPVFEIVVEFDQSWCNDECNWSCTVEVPDAQLARWRRVVTEWEAVQDEMGKFVYEATHEGETREGQD